MQAEYQDSAARVKKMSFLRLACLQFNVYNNNMVRLTFTAGHRLRSAGAAQSFPVPSFFQIPQSQPVRLRHLRRAQSWLADCDNHGGSSTAAQQGSGMGSLTLKTWRK
jgi:hypothetical protein